LNLRPAAHHQTDPSFSNRKTFSKIIYFYRMRKYITYFIVATFLFLSSCSGSPERSGPVRIAITKTNDYYSALVERNGNNTEWVNLYGMRVDSAINMLRQCDGLLVTGGEDVYPGLYGKLFDTARCEGFDRYRDSLELAVIHLALEENKPIFGVCRGLQILNVALGGTLIIDIPSDFDTIVKHRKKNETCYHEVTIVPNTLVFKLGGVSSEMVNSAHHQGIDHFDIVVVQRLQVSHQLRITG
jgi:gamma-glutamyl-gamma-aminobutyrate hydrolase PuuD